MFAFAILIGIYSYLIFVLGLLGVLFKNNIIVATSLYVLLIVFFEKEVLLNFFQSFKIFKQVHAKKIIREKLIIFFFLIFLVQALVNFIGALGPEYAFDALWYHLTLPKIYLLNHSIFHIPGNLLYYSDMPRLGEMLYTAALSLQDEILAKVIHFSFGILSTFALYKLSRKLLSQKLSLLAALLFYSNLVVAWESTTAYVDFFRTFFEIMAFLGFINWLERSEKKWLLISSLMLGLAISAKILAVGSLLIFAILIGYKGFIEKKIIVSSIVNILAYWCISIFTALPWFVFSFVNTGNPIYPILSNYYVPNMNNSFNPLNFISAVWSLFTRSSDPVSPLYLVFLPFSLFIFKTANQKLKTVFIYSLLSIFIWYFTPGTEGGRFILPYLPVLSILTIAIIYSMKSYKKIYSTSIFLIIVLSFMSIFYRGITNSKFIPVILGKESKEQFLKNHLNFSFGDFYDVDGYFKNKIRTDDKVLLYGFHNLYYVDFPFIDSSWVKKGDTFNYIAVQKNTLPERFKDWNMIYNNSETNVKLYSNNISLETY